jgi:two-component system nitrogen regulation response regulator GlnG
VRRLAALYSDDVINISVIEQELQPQEITPSEDAPGEDESLGMAVERHIAKYFAAHAGSLPPRGLYERVIREVERPLLSLSLEATNGNQIKAAELLGVNRNTLRKKIRELDIQVVRGMK